MACAAFAHVTVLNNGTKVHFTWYIKVFQANIKFYQKVKIQARKFLISMECSNMQTKVYTKIQCRITINYPWFI